MIGEYIELIAAAVPLLAGLLAAYRRYHRTGQLSLSRLPWRALRRLLYEGRKTYFTVEKPDAESFTVERSLEGIKTVLGDKSYNPRWALSYHYYGESYNARMYYLDPSREYPHRQVHVRGFENEDGAVELMCHEEPAPEHHPRAHLREDDMQPANQWVAESLNGGRKA